MIANSLRTIKSETIKGKFNLEDNENDNYNNNNEHYTIEEDDPNNNRDSSTIPIGNTEFFKRSEQKKPSKMMQDIFKKMSNFKSVVNVDPNSDRFYSNKRMDYNDIKDGNKVKYYILCYIYN
jgi:hypothetical protein